MIGRRITLFELLGFKINVDATWIFLAVIVTWSLSTAYFPNQYPNYPPATYWAMGGLGSLGLFASIIFHELSHSVVARRYGLRIAGITLFIFGGVAEMEQEPPSAKAEFLMAVAGPLASLALAVGFYVAGALGQQWAAPETLVAVLLYLALINFVLAVFNMIPAFPLDGGRALRAVLWHLSSNIEGATRRAAAIGNGFGLVLIAMGVFLVVTGNFITGLWWGLIGLFLRGAADASVSDLRARGAFKGERVERFMTRNVVTVTPDVTIATLVDEFIYAYHFDLFPVVANGRLIGSIDARSVRALPREAWMTTRVADVMEPLSARNTIDPKADAFQALVRMRQNRTGRLLVTDGHELFGILVLKDMLEYLGLKLELEGHA